MCTSHGAVLKQAIGPRRAPVIATPTVGAALV
jgi:hypothetical protein